MKILNMKVKEARMFEDKLRLNIDDNNDIELNSDKHLITIKSDDFSAIYYDFMELNREVLSSYLNVRVAVISELETLRLLADDCVQVVEALNIVGVSSMWRSEQPKINLLIFDLDSLVADKDVNYLLSNIMNIAHKVGIMGIFIGSENSINKIKDSIDNFTTMIG